MIVVEAIVAVGDEVVVPESRLDSIQFTVSNKALQKERILERSQQQLKWFQALITFVIRREIDSNYQTT